MAAIDSGFTRALTTIIDSNLTTLFAAVFLFTCSDRARCAALP